ncbi:transcription factor GTE10-like [Bidens hawaiensis]|uniref:transcription factor GTE10-like n=1 Tax=Bidens hawaiensis TaxID=980011 RepID=UPI00404B3A2D
MAPAFPLDSQRVSNKFSQKKITQMKAKTRNKLLSNPRSLAVDSEGYASSSRGSGDSCKPRNKSVSLNSDSFGVPTQVYWLSKLSSLERKQLGSRLKRELERVRAFSKKHVLDVSQSVKKRALPPGANGKAGLPPPVTGNAMLMKQCDALLSRLIGHTHGRVFSELVDVVKYNIPDYHTVIKHPMDLGTVKTKLNSGKYVDPCGFAADVRLTFSNAMTYNPHGNHVHAMAEILSKFFEVRWKVIEKKLSVVTESLVPLRRNVIETEPTAFMPPLKKKTITSFGNEKQEPVKKIMSGAEKHKLSCDLEASLSDLPETIIDFLKHNSSNGNATMDDEVEIDIDALSNETLFKLRKLLDDFLVNKQKNMIQAETCEVEIRNESGPSNSSMQAVKVSVDVNEDVDIGGDELPVTSFPPIEIEKDTAAKNSNCSSSSSSSSDSGSSSSDSDSESDDANISAIVNNIKDTLDSDVNPEQTSAVPRDAEDSVKRVGQVDQKSESVSISCEVDGCQEGMGAPNERRVSPDRLYRSALLRDRYADLISKAENITGKVDQQDRERLRLEKEELERRRKEEKGRLQAEAKAAEEANRKAVLEAAAEAKRKRELEREAARQALQKMEKNVEINDSSRFLEDLEMLSVAPTDPLIDENSVDGYQDPLGSFDMNRKGNPLERLGLYMKNDDEDEEDGDSEEGEFD